MLFMLVGGVDRESCFRINRYLATLLLLYVGIREDDYGRSVH